MSQKKGKKERLDVLMLIRGLAKSREQAKRLILAGEVQLDGVNLPKPGLLVETEIDIHVRTKERYVSRGGLKLEAGLRAFSISVEGKVCLDVGASTGGFTDCMLQHGARLVYAVDVGASQMHEKIRTDGRVGLLEHTNARDMTADLFPQTPGFAAVDVSFISILRVSAPLLEILKPSGSAVLLIKPQFEAGRQAVSRGRGVIRDSAVHREVLTRVLDELAAQGWHPLGLVPSPITGGSGNIEFLCYVETQGGNGGMGDCHIDIDEAILSAGATLK